MIWAFVGCDVDPPLAGQGDSPLPTEGSLPEATDTGDPESADTGGLAEHTGTLEPPPVDPGSACDDTGRAVVPPVFVGRPFDDVSGARQPDAHWRGGTVEWPFGGVDASMSAGFPLGEGDIDGDGYDDLYLGAPAYWVAGVFVVYGPIAPGGDYLLPDGADAWLQTLGQTGLDYGQGGYFGTAMAAADVDGDCRVDLWGASLAGGLRRVPGGPKLNGDQWLEGNSDAAYLPTDVMGPLNACRLALGPSPIANWSTAVAWTEGSWIADEDLEDAFENSGRVLLLDAGVTPGDYSLWDSAVEVRGQMNSYLTSEAALVDVTGDGVAELWVGAETWEPDPDDWYVDIGAAHLLCGPIVGNPVEIMDATCGLWMGEEDQYNFANHTGVAGDLDGDGDQDLWAGNIFYDGNPDSFIANDHGRTWFITQDPTGEHGAEQADVILSGEVDFGGDLMGKVVGGYDLDRDGNDDVVATPYKDEDCGRVWIFYGPIAPGLHVGYGEAEAMFDPVGCDKFGYQADVVGDLNADGVLDLAIGDPYTGQYVGGDLQLFGDTYLYFGGT